MYKMNGTTVSLVDVLLGSGSTYPYNFIGYGTDVLFTADAGSGYELWKYNGTTATQVIDLVSGSANGDPYNFVSNAVTPNGTVFFVANNGTNGYELWKTDGTTLGTTMVKDINPSGDSYPTYLTVVGSYVFFQAYDGTDYELWRSDGTSAGTVKVDVYVGGSSYPVYLTALNSTTLIFQASDATNGVELFKVVGTGAPTVVSINVTPTVGSSSFPGNIVVINSVAYFSATDGSTGYELWSYNGTTLTRLSDLASGTASSYPYGMTQVGATSTIVFQADNTGTGNNYELFKTTGTLASTALVKEINPSTTLSSFPYYMTAMGSYVYFQADDGTNGYELWRSDGTSAGTTLVKDIYSGVTGGSPQNLYVYNNKLYFAARTLANGFEPWTSDGTSGGTTLLKDMNPGQPTGGFSRPLTLGGNMYFLGSDGTGSRIWVTNGQTCATVLTPSFSGAATSSANEIMLATFSGVQKIIFSMNAKGYEREPFILDPAGVSLPVAAAISVQPTPQTVTMPASASFSVTGTGTNLTYQWKKNGTDIPGATSATYTLATTTDTDAGQYSVVVTGTCGQVTSNQVALTVNTITPSAQPTGLTFSNRQVTTLDISFTAATGSPTGYLVLRKEGSAPTEIPVDGTTYAIGSTFGASKVIAAGSTVGGTDTGLSPHTEIFYAIFSFNGSGSLIKYLTTTPLSGSAFTLFAQPADQPTALTFSNLNGATLTGTFTAAPSTPPGYLVIRTAGAAPTYVPIDGRSYSIGEVVGDAVVAYIGTATTFNDAGLTLETSYTYQVFSANGIGPTLNYLATSPLQGSVTTLAAEPSQPTALRFSNVTNNSFTIAYTAPAPAPTGYLVLRNVGGAVTGAPADGTTYVIGNTVGNAKVAYVGAATTFDENIPLVSLFYSVFAFNGSGITTNYRTVAPLSGNIAPDNTAPVIANETLTSIPAQNSLKIVATITEPESSVSTVTVDYKSVSKSGSSTSVPMTLNAGKWEFTVPALEIGDLGVEYKITATNTLSLSSNVSGKTTLTFSDQTIPITSSGSDQTNYRIIAVPLDVTSKTVNDIFVDDLGNVDQTKWRLFRYENKTTTELTATSSIDAGKGYWLITKSGSSVDTGTGKTVAVGSTEPFTIALVDGWNQIGNPYTFNVLWSDVTAASGLNVKLRVYTGTFGDATVLNKFTGGFVFSTGPATLKIPVVYNSAAGRTAAPTPPMTNALDDENWEVRFNASNGNISNILSGFGMNNQANSLYDEFDDFTLPKFLKYIEVNHNKAFHGTSFSKDIVPTATQYVWDFTVDSNLTGATDLSWDNSYFGINSKELVLWDVEEALAIDMKTNTTYSFNQTGSRHFRVYFGSKEFVAEKTAQQTLLFHSLTPNPSESEVGINFTIPGNEMRQVQVNVVNTLGQSISRIFDGSLNGGYHQLMWTGKDAYGVKPAQGIYIVEIVAGSERQSKRLVIK